MRDSGNGNRISEQGEGRALPASIYRALSRAEGLAQGYPRLFRRVARGITIDRNGKADGGRGASVTEDPSIPAAIGFDRDMMSSLLDNAELFKMAVYFRFVCLLTGAMLPGLAFFTAFPIPAFVFFAVYGAWPAAIRMLMPIIVTAAVTGAVAGQYIVARSRWQAVAFAASAKS